MKMTSDWSRFVFKCLTPKTYSSLDDDAYSHVNLLPRGGSTSESPENVSTTPTPNTHYNHNSATTNLNENFRNEKETEKNENSISTYGNNQKHESRARRRSVSDISDTFCDTSSELISQQQFSPNGNNSFTTANNVVEVRSNGREGSTSDNTPNASTSSAGGGLLSFLGARFNKSGTRHLERISNRESGPEISSEKHANSRGIDTRYTKFPVSRSCTSTPTYPSEAQPQNAALPRSNTVVADIGICSILTSADRSATPNQIKQAQPQLQSKSKSDNNLHHRLNLNKNPISQNSSLVLSKVKASRKSENKVQLNSVQLGDHATIRLPWNPSQQQQNNLSSIAHPNRSIPNTHTNIDFNNTSVRYVDSNLWTNQGQTHHQLPASVGSTSQNHFHFSRKAGPSNFCNTNRRSRSLERTSNFRIFQGNHSNANSQDLGTGLPQAHGFNSLERHSRTKVKVNPSEEITVSQTGKKGNRIKSALSRNSSSSSSKSNSESFKPRDTFSFSKSNEFKLKDNLQNLKTESTRRNRPPLLGKLHISSEPNSSFSSCDSTTSNSDSKSQRNEFASSSAPPSPPPRPLCTLKPEKSRPILSSFSFSAVDKPPPVDRALKKRKGPLFITRSASAMSSTSSPLNRRPIPNPALGAHAGIDPSHISETNNLSDSASSLHSAVSPEDISASIPSNPNTTMMSSVEDARNSGFINKPSKGWLHSDQLLTKEGVQYTVRYIGCLDVNTSMKSLDFDTRSLIAKECINQICEAAGLKSIDRKRKPERRLIRLLGLRPRLEHAGTDVHLTITSTCLKLTSLETGAIIAVHEMPNISFASGGDSTMLDFVAYVAKDSVVGRACFVLECGSGLAQDVITTVGQAFELRFKEYLQKRPAIPVSIARLPTDDPEYYNDLPGKIPPDIIHKAKDSNGVNVKPEKSVGKTREPPKLTLPDSTSEFSVNLIDFEAPTPPAFGPTVQDKSLVNLLLDASPTVLKAEEKQDLPLSQTDPFDMQPFEASLKAAETHLTPTEQKMQLESESWFHGSISRSEAELLVVDDGDFLVRESQTTPGQYVLTGIQNGSAKHLLLVDPNGIVRTRDNTFESVTHLIHHHCDNSRPIISAESMVLLIKPVLSNKTISRQQT